MSNLNNTPDREDLEDRIDRPTGDPKKDFNKLNGMLMAAFVIGNIAFLHDRIGKNLKDDQTQSLDDVSTTYDVSNRKIAEQKKVVASEKADQCEAVRAECLSNQKPTEACAPIVKGGIDKFVRENLPTRGESATAALAQMAMAEGNVDYSIAAKSCVIDTSKKVNACLQQQLDCLNAK